MATSTSSLPLMVSLSLSNLFVSKWISGFHSLLSCLWVLGGNGSCELGFLISVVNWVISWLSPLEKGFRSSCSMLWIQWFFMYYCWFVLGNLSLALLFWCLSIFSLSLWCFLFFSLNKFVCIHVHVKMLSVCVSLLYLVYGFLVGTGRVCSISLRLLHLHCR